MRKFFSKVFGVATTLFVLASVCCYAARVRIPDALPVLGIILVLLIMLRRYTELQNRLDIFFRVAFPPYQWWSGNSLLNAALIALSLVEFLRLTGTFSKNEEKAADGIKKPPEPSPDSKPNEEELRNAVELDFRLAKPLNGDSMFMMIIDGDALRVQALGREWRNVPSNKPLIIVIEVSDPDSFEAVDQFPPNQGRTPGGHRVFWVLKIEGNIVAGPTSDPTGLKTAAETYLWKFFTGQSEGAVLEEYKKSGPPLV